MLISYFRVFVIIQLDPGVTPLGQSAVHQKTEGKKRSGREKDVEAANRYEPRPDGNPDSPGLEAFYSKDVFVCETDGRPRWCSTCCNWKLDRAHHCSELQRCVKKMDHYCPWVGGIVAETCESWSPSVCSACGTRTWLTTDSRTTAAFKFFVQFTFYATLYWIVTLVAAILCFRLKLGNAADVDGLSIGVLAVAAFFGLFTVTMTLSSTRYILSNLTTVDYVKSKNVVHQLAIRVPRGTPSSQNYNVITYPLPKSTNGSALPGQTVTIELPSPRDELATRTFAIVKTEMGENPWDLGYYRNWKSVMGNNILDWLLPLKESPCAKSETNESFYEMGPLYHQLRTRFGLPEVSGGKERAEPEMGEPDRRRTDGMNGSTTA